MLLCSLCSLNSFSSQKKLGHFFYTIPEEGFCAETVVKTPYGYKVIEDLSVGDVVIDCNGDYTTIVATSKRHVDKCIKLFLEDACVLLGCDQQVYSISDVHWIRACDKLNGELVVQPTVLYAVTTQSETLCVTEYDICVHNAPALLLGASSICLGHVAIINPVMALLGGVTISLGYIAYNAYKSYDTPDSVVSAERFYYEKRKAELESIKQELMGIKSELEAATMLYSSNVAHLFLKQHMWGQVNNGELISLDQERYLSNEQKQQLREIREAELRLLEKEVQDLQLLLALHANQIVGNCKKLSNECEKIIPEVEQAINKWNSSHSKRTIGDAFNVYERILWQENLVYLLHQAFDELKIVAEYYGACESRCIQLSTTILEVLQYSHSLMFEIKQALGSLLQDFYHNSRVIEKYFIDNNISTEAFKAHIKQGIEVQKKEQEINALEIINSEFSSSGFTGGPKKDDEDEYHQKVEIYEKNALHIFRNDPGHFPIDTPVNRKILVDTASDVRNFLGKCKYGNEWYAKILENGEEIWVSVRGGFIRNGGLNKSPYNFNF